MSGKLPAHVPTDRIDGAECDPIVASVYCDGGVIARNPSDVAGTWAWCHVNAAGERVRAGSGLVLPGDYGLATISNNVTELVAMLRGLDALPFGWSGMIYTDSGVTMARMRAAHAAYRGLDQKKLDVPEPLRAEMLAVIARLDGLMIQLLGGHPSRAELAQGRRKDGKAVSIHNVWCDRECTRIGRAHVAALEREGS